MQNFSLSASSAMEAVSSKGPLSGRPFGGVAILVNKALCLPIKLITCKERHIILQINDLMLCNVYNPVRSVANDLDVYCDLLTSVINDIMTIITMISSWQVI